MKQEISMAFKFSEAVATWNFDLRSSVARTYTRGGQGKEKMRGGLGGGIMTSIHSFTHLYIMLHLPLFRSVAFLNNGPSSIYITGDAR